MRISELAATSGVPATTLRYYESVGLVTAKRGTNGYRDYDDDALAQLSFIEAAKQLGMSLPEIVELLTVIEGESCTQVREVLHPKLRQRLLEVDKRLANLHLECALLGARRETCATQKNEPKTTGIKGTR